MRYLKSACGIPSSLCAAADCQNTQMALPTWPRVAVMAGIWWGKSRLVSQGGIVARQTACPAPQMEQLRSDRTEGLSLLLLVFLVMLFEWLCLHGISVFLGWLKISSEVKDGKKVKCSGIQSCGWSTWDCLSQWPVLRKHSIFLWPVVFLYTGWLCASLSNFVPQTLPLYLNRVYFLSPCSFLS